MISFAASGSSSCCFSVDQEAGTSGKDLLPCVLVSMEFLSLDTKVSEEGTLTSCLLGRRNFACCLMFQAYCFIIKEKLYLPNSTQKKTKNCSSEEQQLFVDDAKTLVGIFFLGLQLHFIFYFIFKVLFNNKQHMKLQDRSQMEKYFQTYKLSWISIHVIYAYICMIYMYIYHIYYIYAYLLQIQGMLKKVSLVVTCISLYCCLTLIIDPSS